MSGSELQGTGACAAPTSPTELARSVAGAVKAAAAASSTVAAATFAPAPVAMTAAQRRISKAAEAMASKTQAELAQDFLKAEDMEFAGDDIRVRQELLGFRKHLATASDPFATYRVERLLGKGTAGWVFLVAHKEVGEQLAMKIMRMTNASTGVKEWYVSKLLRKLGVEDVVLTAEEVFVLKRAETDPIVDEALTNAGPVPFYICQMQQLMPWGCLEDGQLPPKCLFRALAAAARTLAAMHANGLQHADVKPANIMLVKEGDEVTSAKLCDLGSALIGDDPEDCQDDVRRFGVTLFAAVTGEGWTEKRLLHEQHDALVERLTTHLQGSGEEEPATRLLQGLPELLRWILDQKPPMAEVAASIKELAEQ